MSNFERAIVAFAGTPQGLPHDDIETLRRSAQKIDLANTIWRSWIELSGGSMIELAGPEGIFEIPSEKLDRLPAIRDQYAEAIGSDVRVGVGMEPNEAKIALLVSKKGNQSIVLFGPETEKQLKATEETEEKKTSSSNLNKSEDLDLETKMHALAQAQDKVANPQESGINEGLKSKIVSILQQIKAAAPDLERISRSSPQTYSAIKNLVSSVIVMARQTAKGVTDKGQTSVAEIDAATSTSQPLGKAVDPFFEKTRIKNKAVKDRATELASTTKGSAWRRRQGGSVVVSVNTHPNKPPYRSTWFSAEGEPQGHYEHQTHEEALTSAHNMGADILGQPLKVLTKNEEKIEWFCESDLIDDSLIKTEELLKAGEFKEAAFRHRQTGQIIGTGPLHDEDQLPPGSDGYDWENGFVDHKGQFYNREEAASKVKVRPYTTEENARFRNKDIDPSSAGGLESSRYFAETPNPTIGAHLLATGGGLDVNNPEVKTQLKQNWENYNKKYAKSEDYAGYEYPSHISSKGYRVSLDPTPTGVIGTIHHNNNPVGRVELENGKFKEEWPSGKEPHPDIGVATRVILDQHVKDNPIKRSYSRIPRVPKVCSMGGVAKRELSIEDLTGGLSDGKKITDFDPKDIAKGVLVELEHTDKIDVAVKIAMDHLCEDRNYYSKLKEMEGENRDKIEKSGIGRLPKPHVTTRENLVLPVGTKKDPGPEGTRGVGKILTQGADGKEKWRSARAGMVLGPDGSARSALAVNDK